LILLAPPVGAMCSAVSACLLLARFSCESSLELRDQSRQGFRLFIRGEVAAGQTLDPKTEHFQPFLREVHLPVFKGIFVAAAYQERELIAISLEEVTEVEPVALRFVIRHEAGRCA